jgi:hypothetical protein
MKMSTEMDAFVKRAAEREIIHWLAGMRAGAKYARTSVKRYVSLIQNFPEYKEHLISMTGHHKLLHDRIMESLPRQIEAR